MPSKSIYYVQHLLHPFTLHAIYMENQMQELPYTINKGVNRPIEFRGLKAQYFYYLAIGLAVLLILFCVMYISGVPVYLGLVLILALGAGLFTGVTRLSHRFGEYGLKKLLASRKLPKAIRPVRPTGAASVTVFRRLDADYSERR